jgi:hypothetical protein
VEKIIDDLMGDLFEELTRKLSFFWPKKGAGFPPEENLSLEIARLGLKYNYDIYGEVNVQNRSRRDLFLINHEDKWICQVELKLININTCRSGAVLKDLDRVKSIEDLDYALTHYSKKDDLKNYRKYGLFFGGDISYWFSWWLGVKDNSMKEYLSQCLDSIEDVDSEDAINQLYSRIVSENSISGVIPQNPKNGNLWLAYTLFNLSDS